MACDWAQILLAALDDQRVLPGVNVGGTPEQGDPPEGNGASVTDEMPGDSRKSWPQEVVQTPASLLLAAAATSAWSQSKLGPASLTQAGFHPSKMTEPEVWPLPAQELLQWLVGVIDPPGYGLSISP